ncbi:MAG: C40 family peptidase [Thermoleophilia bacterium]
MNFGHGEGSLVVTYDAVRDRLRCHGRVVVRVTRALSPGYAVSLVLVLLALAGLSPARAFAAFADVPTTQWAYTAITAVTKLGPADAPAARVLVDYGPVFRPDLPCTREQLAKALVLAAGQENLLVVPVPLLDVTVSDPNYTYCQIALRLGFMAMKAGGFRPHDGVLEWEADRSLVSFVKLQGRSADWTMLTHLGVAGWQPNAGWTTGAPAYLPWEIAARSLGLRFNHPSSADAEELSPQQVIDRAEIAYMLNAALNVVHKTPWRIAALAQYDTVVLPPLSERQKQIVAFALHYIGYPYVWGGEYPTVQGANAPYGPQAHGGFDCSGFVWWVMKIHFGYPIVGRGAHDIAAESKSRVPMAKLVAGDVVFFAPQGPKSNVNTIFHTGIALGNGWFIHSTGSSDGVTIAALGTKGDYWYDTFAWGRRLLSPAELKLPPSPAPSPSSEATATPRPTSTASPSSATELISPARS